MAYSENDLTSMRRDSETLFTEFVATQFLSWRGSDGSTSIVAKQADGCVAAQRIVHALDETGGEGVFAQAHPASLIDDFLIMVSHARLLMHFFGGFYDASGFPHDVDLGGLERHVGVSSKPPMLMIIEAIARRDGDGRRPPSPALRALKRRHWNRIVIDKRLAILPRPSSEQFPRILELLHGRLHESHMRAPFYCLGYDHQNELRSILAG